MTGEPECAPIDTLRASLTSVRPLDMRFTDSAAQIFGNLSDTSPHYGWSQSPAHAESARRLATEGDTLALITMGSHNVPSLPALAGVALRSAIREAARAVLDLDRHQLFIFGSEASGLADRRSDIDVAILGPQPVPGAIMERIRERLESLRTLRRFDVVDLSHVDERFRTEALRHAAVHVWARRFDQPGGMSRSP